MWSHVAPGGFSHREQESDLFSAAGLNCVLISSLNSLPFNLSLDDFLHLRSLLFGPPLSQWLICSCSKWISRKFDTSTGHCALLNARLLLSAALPAFEWAWRGADWHRRWRWVNLNLCIFRWRKSPGPTRVPLIRLHKTYSKRGIVCSESLNTHRCSLTMLHTAQSTRPSHNYVKHTWVDGSFLSIL